MSSSDLATSLFRPTGYDITAYAGHESWDGERWAWEFLRRNTRFQNWCCEVENSELATVKRNQLALHKFGLLRYKFFAENFADRYPPKFAIKKIRWWARSTRRQIEKRPSNKVSIQLKKGEVLVKFDVRGTHKSHSSIKAQLEEARKVLEDAAKWWSKRRGVEKTSWMRNRNQMLPLLRLIDAQAYAASLSDIQRDAAGVCKTPGDLYSFIFENRALSEPGRNREDDLAADQERLDDKKEIANRFLKKDYIALAVMNFSTQKSKRK